MEILEINTKQLSLLDAENLQALINIFKGVSRPEAKTIVKQLSSELLKRKNESADLEEAKRMKYDKVIKKLRDGEWDTSMDVKKRMHLTYTDNNTGKQKVVFVESDDLEEASDKDLDIKSIKALIKKPSPDMIKQYGGKDKYIKMLKSKLAKLESTELVEANNRLIAHTPAAAKRLIKKLKNKFSGYAWDGRVKGDEIIYPNEPHIKRFIKKQPEVADMKEEVELEEGKSVRVKTRTRTLKYTYDELLPEVQKIVIMSKVVAKKNRMDVAKKIAKAIIAGKIKNPDISSDLATLIGVDQPYPGAAPRGVVKDQMKKLKLESTELKEVKNIIKILKRASKKIGGIISKVMDSPEFQAAYALYVDNPNDPRALKKAQKYADYQLSGSPLTGFEQTQNEVTAQDKVAALAAVGGAAALAKRLSRKGRADAAEKKLKKQKEREEDKERLAKAKKELRNRKLKKRLDKANDSLRKANTPAQKADAKERITKIKKSMQEKRIIRACSIVLGEDFDQDFIYENIDFSKPSVIKEEYNKYLNS